MLVIGIRRILCLVRRVSTVTTKWKFVRVISHIGGICDRIEVLEIPPKDEILVLGFVTQNRAF